MQRFLARLVFAVVLAWAGGALAEQPSRPAPDLTREHTLYVVLYSHLDTQWRWDYVKTINTFIPATLRDNFALIEKYPHYVFNFTGSNRYRMIKEYYPADYERVKKYVAAGRWFPAGSSVEEGDVVLVSPESIVRQVLYGNRFFQREFGKTSAEFMLPDCFGFPATLPTILTHMGLKGFSTQKLTWRSAVAAGGPGSPHETPAGIPFNVGVWEGLDGTGIVAALNAGRYVGTVGYDLSKSPDASLVPKDAPERVRKAVEDWPARVKRNGDVGGLYVDYAYYGVGDRGGAPLEASVRVVDGIVSKRRMALPSLDWMSERFPTQPEPPPIGPPVQLGDGPLRVVAGTAEQMFVDIRPEQTRKLSRYRGDMLLTKHSTGMLTSQAYMKRWNRHNELLADAAERASVAAQWLGGLPYPQDRLRRAWELFLAAQFHDILPGTSIPEAYEYSWNDEILAGNQFAGVLTSASEAIASRLDTRAKGAAVVVYNPLNIDREDIVEASVAFPAGSPGAIRVVGPDGKDVPAQLKANGTVLFLARVPSVGYAVFDVRPAAKPGSTTLKISESSLENGRYLVKVDENGDVASVYDKRLRRELLAAPMRLAFQSHSPRQTPAWDMEWEHQRTPPRGYVAGPARVRIVENGPARVALAIERDGEGSRFVQTIRLSAGDAGERVELANAIDWKSAGAALKATFPLQAANREATYNWGVGNVRRGNNDAKKYEVPSHQWIDLTDASGTHGVTILTDCKYGSDKPDDHTLRLTLLYTPGIDPETRARSYPDQGTQDWGHHDFVYGLAGHAGDLHQARTDWQALRVNQPLVAFATSSHPGPLGKRFSVLRVSDPHVLALALKKAESGDEVVLRVGEIAGQAAKGVRLELAAPVTSAREIDGSEVELGTAKVHKGALTVDLKPFSIRSFALRLAKRRARLGAPPTATLVLPYDLAVATTDGTTGGGNFDASGRSIAAELLPARIAQDGIEFQMAPAATGKANAVVARGQTLALPRGEFNRIHVLAASAEGDRQVTFRVDNSPRDLVVHDWSGFIGQWDNRVWSGRFDQDRRGDRSRKSGPSSFPTYQGLKPGFVKQAPVAWFAEHRHGAAGANEPYARSYLYGYVIDAPPGARTLVLPDDPMIRILAVTVSKQGAAIRPARPLFDTLGEAPTARR